MSADVNNMGISGLENVQWGPDWQNIRALWPLDPNKVHLNHGSYGAVPIPVRDRQRALRAQTDFNPEHWFRQHLPTEIASARTEIASFCMVPANSIALMPNVSMGAATVLANIVMRSGDEIVMTNHAYRAVRFAAERRCRSAQGVIVTANIRLGASAEEMVEALDAAMTERTRLVIVDHISSETAMLFPVADIIAKAHARGVPVLVDGAHAPGMLPLDVGRLEADFWVGNLHKWCCAPHGSAVLYVSEPYRKVFETLTVGTYNDAAFPGNFDYTGTMDYTSWLAAPTALALLGEIGWARIRRYNNALCAAGQSIVGAELRVPASEMWGHDALSMRVVPLSKMLVSSPEAAVALKARLAEQYGLETLIKLWHDQPVLRLSAHIYNTLQDYEKLAYALRDIRTH